MNYVVLVLAASATALATGLGAIPVFLLGDRATTLRPALWGLAAGVMTVASIVGLLIPGFRQGSASAVCGGAAVGVLFLAVTKWLLDSGGGPDRVDALFNLDGEHRRAHARTSVLVFIVLFAHSLPEGFAVGTAYASESAQLGIFVIIAIGLQNIPEGTSTAIPMQLAGFSRTQQFWAAVGTSVPQPIGAVIAYVLVQEISGLLPLSFGFAAGAMLALVAIELVPRAFAREEWRAGALGAAAGGLVMVALDVLLRV